VEGLEFADLAALGRQALALDGMGTGLDCGLQVSAIPRHKVVRFAFDAPFAYGRRGVAWYRAHHALARLLSVSLATTVHAYAFDPDEGECVVGYGNGRKVGGESLRCEEAELPEEADGELDEAAFQRMKERWPMGHLAYVFGVTRAELLALPRAETLLLPLGGPVYSSEGSSRSAASTARWTLAAWK
jgi:hypothetical protein